MRADSKLSVAAANAEKIHAEAGHPKSEWPRGLKLLWSYLNPRVCIVQSRKSYKIYKATISYAILLVHFGPSDARLIFWLATGERSASASGMALSASQWCSWQHKLTWQQSSGGEQATAYWTPKITPRVEYLQCCSSHYSWCFSPTLALAFSHASPIMLKVHYIYIET